MLATTAAKAEMVDLIGGGDDAGVVGDDPISVGGDQGGDVGDIGTIGDDGCISPRPGADDQFEIPPLVGGNTIDLLGANHRRPVACFARNLRGQIFDAMGVGERRTQDEAMLSCLRASRQCIPLGCQRLL